MKRIYLIILLLISYRSFGQNLVQSLDGRYLLKSNYSTTGWINVMDYGAVGDSITDCTNSIKSAIASISATKSTLYFPKGIYLVSDSLVLDSACIVMGDGGLMPYDYDAKKKIGGISKIVQTDSTRPLFVVNKNGTQFNNIALLNHKDSATATSAGIKFNRGSSMRMINTSVNGFYDNVQIINGLEWMIDGCEIMNAVRYCVSINHELISDEGDAVITNSWLLGGKHPGMTYIKHFRGGGLKMTNLKFHSTFNETDYGYPALGMYDCDFVPTGSSVLLISNNSLENYTGFAIKIRNQVGASHGKIIISNNQMGSFQNIPIHDIDIVASALNQIISVQVVNNSITTYNDASAHIYLENIAWGDVHGNTVAFSSNATQFVNCTNIKTNVSSELTIGSVTNANNDILRVSSTGLVTKRTAAQTLTDIGALSSATAWVPGGNTFGATSSIGLNDNFGLHFKTNNLVRGGFDPTGSFFFGTVTLPQISSTNYQRFPLASYSYYGTNLAAGAVGHTSVTGALFGYGIYNGGNIYFDGTNWIQPRSAVAAYVQKVSSQNGFDVLYQAPTANPDFSTVTPTKILSATVNGVISTVPLTASIAASGSTATTFLTHSSGLILSRTVAQVRADISVPTSTTLTGSGTGAATAINVTLPSTSTWVMVGAANAAAAGITYWTVSGTTLTINYAVAPANGTNNLSYWIEYK